MVRAQSPLKFVLLEVTAALAVRHAPPALQASFAKQDLSHQLHALLGRIVGREPPCVKNVREDITV